MPQIYITGHRNPDTDSIASAIGYAELLRRLRPDDEYVPVRLGDVNAQTRWALERSGAIEPELLPHVFLRACDVMRRDFSLAGAEEPVREGGIKPELRPPVFRRAGDVMGRDFSPGGAEGRVREVGRTMARGGLALAPIVDDAGARGGVMPGRARARRYIRESREASSLV